MHRIWKLSPWAKQSVRSMRLHKSSAWQSFGGFLSQEVNPNLVQIRSSLETLDQASDMCGSIYLWSTGVLFQELQWAASTEQETEVWLRVSEPSGFIWRQLSAVWSNQLTAVGSAELDAPVSEMPALDSYCEPWTRRLPVQGHGEERVCCCGKNEARICRHRACVYLCHWAVEWLWEGSPASPL